MTSSEHNAKNLSSSADKKTLIDEGEYDDVCFECNGPLIIDNTRGERTCANCGLVIESGIIDLGCDWRAYNAEENAVRARSGDPLNPLVDDYGLHSSIGTISRDAQGNQLSSSRKFEFARLSRLDSRSRQGEMRNLRVALKELQRIVSQLELPESVARTASLIYRRALRLDLVRGRSIDSMIAASVYLACRQSAIPLTLKDILVSTPNVSAKDLGRCVRITIRYMNLHIKSSDFTAYVHRLGESLRMNMQSRELAVKILDRAKSEGLTMGKKPM